MGAAVVVCLAAVGEAEEVITIITGSYLVLPRGRWEVTHHPHHSPVSSSSSRTLQLLAYLTQQWCQQRVRDLVLVTGDLLHLCIHRSSISSSSSLLYITLTMCQSGSAALLLLLLLLRYLLTMVSVCLIYSYVVLLLTSSAVMVVGEKELWCLKNRKFFKLNYHGFSGILTYSMPLARKCVT